MPAKTRPRGSKGARGELGAQGKPGAPGARGVQGERGPAGARGERGERGARGQAGHRGARGERGPAGPSPSRADILAAVEEQFADIRKQLDIQLTRFAQLQAQLDHIEKLLRQLVGAS